MSEIPVSAASDADALFARAQRGDPVAWEALFHECYPKVRRVVRRKLDPPMRRYCDSTDLASDVWKSLTAKCDRFDFPSIDSLMAFLTKMAEQKVIDEYRRRTTDKRDMRRVQALDDEGGPDATQGFASNDPTPSQIVQAIETKERLMAGLTPDERVALDMRLENHSNEAIASTTGWHVRKVQRFFQDLHDSWKLSGGWRP